MKLLLSESVKAVTTVERKCYVVTAGGKKGGKKGAVNGKKEEESDIFKLVKMIMQRRFDPVIFQA